MKEIRHILSKLLKKKGSRDINIDKFMHLVENSEFICEPSHLPDAKMFLMEYNNEQRSGDAVKSFRGISLFKGKGSRLFLGAAAVSVCIVAIVTYTLFFSHIPVEPVENYGFVEKIIGRTFLTKGNKRVLLKKGDVIRAKDCIVTGPHSSVDVTYKKHVQMRIVQNSRMVIKKSNYTDIDYFEFMLEKGKILLYVKKMRKNSSVVIHTPFSSAIVKGTFFSVDIRKEKIKYTVYDGKLKVFNKINSHIAADERIVEAINEKIKTKSIILDKNHYCNLYIDKNLINKITNVDSEKAWQIDSMFRVPKKRRIHVTKKTALRDALKFANKLNSGGVIDSVDEIIDPLFVKQLHYMKSFAHWKKSLRSDFLLYDTVSGYLLAYSESGKLEAANMRKVVWKLHEGVVKSVPVVFNGKVFFLDHRNTIRAVDIWSGKTIWSAGISPYGRYNYLSVNSNCVLLAFYDNKTTQSWLYKLTPGGKLLWKVSFKRIFSSSPVAANTIIFVPLGYTLVGVDRKTGLKIIKSQFSGMITGILRNDYTLYLSTRNGVFYSYDIRKGEKKWKHNCDSAVKGFLFDRNSIFVIQKNGHIIKLNSKGDIIWQVTVAGVINSKPLHDNNNIYVTSYQTLYLIDKNHGHIKWSVVTKPFISKNMALSPGSIYFVSKNKGLVVLNK